MPLEHWAMLTIQQTLTATGYIIVITTNVPCHLYMRWSTKPPWIHHVPVLQRGIFMHTDIQICFTVYEDNQQEEAGDTLTHTFIKEPWPVCETRWFYFHGTINGVASPSTSPIFKKHRGQPPIEATFYPGWGNAGPGVDGYVRRWAPYSTWSQIREGAGTAEDDTYAAQYIELYSAANPDTYHAMARIILVFDTSSIPADATIVSAEIGVRPYSWADPANWKPEMGVYTSYPASTNALVPADYNPFGDTLLSSTLKYDDIDGTKYNIMTFNSAALAAINKGGFTKLGIREAKYDGPNNPPTWVVTKRMIWWIRTREYVTGTWPYLKVTYEP